MKCLKFLKLLSMALVLIGCSNRVILPYETPSAEKVVYEIDFYAWGLVGNGSIDIFSDCPQGRAYQVHSFTSPTQALWTVLSLGVYSPKMVEVTCSGVVSKLRPAPEPEEPQKDRVPHWDRKRFFTPPPKIQTPNSKASDQR